LTAGRPGNDTQRRSRGGRRSKVGKTLTKDAAKQRVLELIEAGYTVKAACAEAGRSEKTYEYWKRNDPDFDAKVKVIRSVQVTSNPTRDDNRLAARRMGFVEWRKKYLKVDTFWHQYQWLDLLEGREPRDLHPAQTFQSGRKGRILINTPPAHSKTTFMTVDYSVYRICCDPNVRIALVSETEGMAKKFLAEIKDKLTQPEYAELIRDFAPEGGFKQSAEIWGATQIKISSQERTKAQKDPTVEALGIGSQIYGSRLDLIFLDDCVGTGNAGHWKSQMEWFKRMVVNRPGPGGRIIVVGTRVSPEDLYGQFLNGENYASNRSPWAYLAQPAVLEEPTEDNPEGRTLWPMASVPADGVDEEDPCEICDGTCHIPRDVDGMQLYPKWDMTHLSALRADNDERSWQMVYQQQAIPDDADFPEYAVRAAINNRRASGLRGGLDTIPESCYWILSLDPAVTGAVGAVLYAVDPKTMMRYVANVANPSRQTPGQLKNLVKRWCVEYPVKEVVIEDDSLNKYFTQEAEFRSWLIARGVRFTSHQTGGGKKWEPGWGIAAMAQLFGAWDKDEQGMKYIQGTRRIELPRLDHPALVNLVKQLTIWTPELDPKKTPCDLVMALWFAECSALRLLKPGNRSTGTHQKSKWLSPMARAKQGTINLSEVTNRQVA
jgi:hypothetical protein